MGSLASVAGSIRASRRLGRTQLTVRVDGGAFGGHRAALVLKHVVLGLQTRLSGRTLLLGELLLRQRFRFANGLLEQLRCLIDIVALLFAFSLQRRLAS